ncbi:J domain-containing protein [Litchfieldia alkalitelluris]|uniref:J domain-containing protein n=1 Tax=Litchfieldia alkalitelluris TaxID=304268 RepID=UPI0009969486|nr:tetratricopeptide repeat protein [Litchfieldia alkalitelluris]
MESSYYDLLELPQDASLAEVRKAYITKIRQYPNESYPEKFKLIRKAYDVLSNPNTRREYDTMSIYGEEIMKLQAAAQEAVDSRMYEEAVSSYKKILMIEPALLTVRNEYALALISNEEYDKAIRQLEKLVNQDKENAVYVYHLGFAYEKMGNNQKAIYYYTQSINLDPSNVYVTYALCDIYISLKDYDNARKLINEALAKNSNEGFQQFYYLFRHLQIDIYAKDAFFIRKTLKTIDLLLVEHPDQTSFVANEYGKFASELFDYKQFEWAIFLTEKGVELDSSNTTLVELHTATKENKELFGEFYRLEKDEKIVGPLRYSLFLYLFSNEYSEDEFQERLDEMYKNVELSASYDSVETISSVKRISIKYPHLYEIRESFFSNVLEWSQKGKIRDEQYELLNNDSMVVNSVKRLIALYLSDVSEDERRTYFEDIMDEMSYERASSVIQSVNRLEGRYPSLYDLNPSFLEKIKNG